LSKRTRFTILGWLVLMSCDLTYASSCAWFIKSDVARAQFISISVESLMPDPSGLLGAEHYTESLAAAYGLMQVGVKFEDHNLKLLVDGFVHGQWTSLTKKTRLSGDLVEIGGEPILLIRRRFEAEAPEDAGGSRVLNFRAAPR